MHQLVVTRPYLFVLLQFVLGTGPLNVLYRGESCSSRHHCFRRLVAARHLSLAAITAGMLTLRRSGIKKRGNNVNVYLVTFNNATNETMNL